MGVLKKVLSVLNIFEFFANFKWAQCFLSMLNMILSIHKKLGMLKNLSMLKPNFEKADGLGIRFSKKATKLLLGFLPKPLK